MNVTVRKVISVLIMFLALIFGATTGTGFSLGDKFFLALGISPWTNGQTGFRLPILVAFILFIIGVLVARKVMSGTRILILIILLPILVSPTLSLIKPIYYGMHNGLEAIEYDPGNAQINFKTSRSKKYIEITASIPLANYGNDSMQFGIKVPSDDEFHRGWLSQDLILGTQGSPESKTFTLAPGEKRTILAYSKILPRNSEGWDGSTNGPDLILFTDKETRMVGENL